MGNSFVVGMYGCFSGLVYFPGNALLKRGTNLVQEDPSFYYDTISVVE